jgi:Cu/Zn superoxide dismutase
MRRIMLVVLALSVAIAVPAALAASKNKFSATLNGKSETPPTKSAGTGAANFVISKSGKAISYTINAKGLSGPVQAIHIHFGKKGKAGPVILPICLKPCTLPKKGKLTKKDFAKAAGVANFGGAVRDLRAGKTYVNIHTAKDPGGEIRGQIRPKK